MSYWYNQKDRRINQKKRKQYKKRTSSKKSRESFDIDKFAMEIEDSTSGSDNDDL